MSRFDKYDACGAYHWRECDRRLANFLNYNPTVDARYQIVAEGVTAIGGGGPLLDVGCGDGYLLSRLAGGPGSPAVGLEYEPEGVRAARQRLRGVNGSRVVRGSAYTLPFAMRSFHVVVSSDVIEHLEDPDLHLRQICGVLSEGGALVLTTPKWRPDRRWDVRHEKEYRADELRTLLERHFRQVALTYYWPLFWSKVYRNRIGWRVLKLLGIAGWNPFLHRSSGERGYGQIIAVCSQPLP